MTCKFKQFAVTMVLAGALASVAACTSSSRANGEDPSSSESRTESNVAGGRLDFRLTNLTGASLRGIYLSSAKSTGWEENLISGTALNDGESINIRFNPNETATTWDMKIEGEDGHYAEWKNLKLGDFLRLSLVVKPSTPLVAVAELE